MSDRVAIRIVSALLGLFLSIAFFRRVCSGDSCVVIKGPGEEVKRGQFYKFEGDCYQYMPYDVSCGDEGKNSPRSGGKDAMTTR